ncbi:MAG: Na+/H+ antiporter subunit E [Haloarculaceae archaeon]
MRRWPVVGVGLAVLWLFVRGVELGVEAVVGEFLIGLGVGLPVAFVFRRFYLPRVDLGARVRGLPYAVVYLVAFLWELLTANIDVAYRVLAPSMPISPEVIEIPLRVESDLAITTIANSITLTPGTLTMDYDEERNSLYVHAIDGRDPGSVVEPVRTWEDYALRIFDEERSPGDPVPTVPDRPGSTVAPDALAEEGKPPEGVDGDVFEWVGDGDDGGESDGE